MQCCQIFRYRSNDIKFLRQSVWQFDGDSILIFAGGRGGRGGSGRVPKVQAGAAVHRRRERRAAALAVRKILFFSKWISVVCVFLEIQNPAV